MYQATSIFDEYSEVTRLNFKMAAGKWCKSTWIHFQMFGENSKVYSKRLAKG